MRLPPIAALVTLIPKYGSLKPADVTDAQIRDIVHTASPRTAITPELMSTLRTIFMSHDGQTLANALTDPAVLSKVMPLFTRPPAPIRAVRSCDSCFQFNSFAIGDSEMDASSVERVCNFCGAQMTIHQELQA